MLLILIFAFASGFMMAIALVFFMDRVVFVENDEYNGNLYCFYKNEFYCLIPAVSKK